MTSEYSTQNLADRLIRFTAACAVILLFAVLASRALAGGFDWNAYARDDFDGTYLKRRWFIHDTAVKIDSGRALLTNSNGVTGSISLKGPFQPRKVYLKWPWAVETCVDLPLKQAGRKIPYCGALGATFCNEKGLKAEARVGRVGGFGADWAFYRMPGMGEDDWAKKHYFPESQMPSITAPGKQQADWVGDKIDRADRVWLRIEGVGDDQRSIRMGIRAAETDPWTWSPTAQLAAPVQWAEDLGLYNGSVQGMHNLEVTGDDVTVGFEYATFAGAPFRFDPPGPPNYVRPDVSPLKPGNETHGKRWTEQVPDTLDLAEVCKLALNSLIGSADPTADGEIYGMVLFSPHGWSCYDANYYNPDVEKRLPVMVHDFGDDVLQPKVVEAIPLMRLACGSDEGRRTGEQMLQWMRKMIGKDGVLYHPQQGRPWGLFCFSGSNPFDPRIQEGQLAERGGSPYVGLMPGRLLLALGSWYAVTKDEALAADMRLLVDGLIQSGGVEAAMKAHPIGVGALIQGLTCCYRLLNYKPALDQAARLVKFMKDESGNFDPQGHFTTHFHTMTFALLAMLDYAWITHDRALMEFVAKAYEYARTKGWPMCGFYPEGVGQKPAACETCEVAEMTALAVKLSAAGVGDYWDDADRYIRNTYSQNQLRETGWIEKLLQNDEQRAVPLDPNCDATRDVYHRMLGWFTSYGTANDWFTEYPRAPGVVACCLGNGSRGLYYLWEGIMNGDEKEGVRVNLLLNRASKWADVNSYLPYTGRVDIKMKGDYPLAVRIPKWGGKPGQVRCRVNDSLKGLRWSGRYASLSGLHSGDRVAFTFAVPEQTVRQTIADLPCELTLRGSTIIGIDPKGFYEPLFDREQMRSGEAPIIQRERFVADKPLAW